MKKRITSILLCIVLLLSVLPALPTAAAAETDDLRTLQNLSPLEERIYLGMMACEERIVLSDLGATRDELEAAMQYLSYAAPELFHLDSTYTTQWQGSTVAAVLPDYIMTGEALEVARARYRLALAEIAAGVDPDWSDVEICLYLHDYLCTAFAYDTTYTVYDAYGFLTEGTGVCQAYTLTYAALLSLFDIPVTFATGMDGSVAHIWNIVTIGGKNYHVDVTWGDPLRGGADVPGYVSHENFLKSDEAIDATGHEGRENHGGIVCNDTFYDFAAFTSFTSPFAFVEGTAYGVKNGKVYSFVDDLSGSTLIYTVTDEWRTGMQYLTEKPAGVAGWGRTLYISTPKSILAYDPVTKTTETYYTLTSGLIMKMYGLGDTLLLHTASDIYGRDAALLTVTLPPVTPPCTGEHTMVEYGSVPSSCSEAGERYLRCSECGQTAAEPLPLLPHQSSATVVPPAYGEAGYTQHVCGVCGHTEITDEVPALPLPTVADYTAAIARAEEAAKPEVFLQAVKEARAMEPHLDADTIRAERAALDALIAEYDARAAEVNAGVGASATALLFDLGILPSHATLAVLLWLLLRRLFPNVR